MSCPRGCSRRALREMSSSMRGMSSMCRPSSSSAPTSASSARERISPSRAASVRANGSNCRSASAGPRQSASARASVLARSGAACRCESSTSSVSIETVSRACNRRNASNARSFCLGRRISRSPSATRSKPNNWYCTSYSLYHRPPQRPMRRVDSRRRGWLHRHVRAGSSRRRVEAGPKGDFESRRSRGGQRVGLFTDAAERLDRRYGWDRLPLPVAMLALIGLRKRLREKNLYDTGRGPLDRPDVSEHPRHLTARTLDGTFNDLDEPLMGSLGSRFGRNVPLESTTLEPEDKLLEPNPRLVSRELLTRHEFQPATTLNLLAGAWIQFEVHDWFSHGKNEADSP